jgi:hypothetical protein
MPGLRLTRLHLLLLAALCGSLTISCTKQIPPPPAPSRSLPAAVDNEEDSIDTYRTPNTSVVVITSDVPAKVERATGIHETPTRTRVLRRHIWETICGATPCSVRLPYGETTLHFVGVNDSSRVSTTTINVGSKRSVINHTLGQERGSVGTYVGVGLVIVGLATLIFPYGFDLDQPKAAPSVFVATGIGCIFGGLTVAALDPSIKQSGATTAWTPFSTTKAPTDEREPQPQQPMPPPPPPPPTPSQSSQQGSMPAVRGVGFGFAF